MAESEAPEAPAESPKEEVVDPVAKAAPKVGPKPFEAGKGINKPVECPFCGTTKAVAHQKYCKKNPAVKAAKQAGLPPQVAVKPSASAPEPKDPSPTYDFVKQRRDELSQPTLEGETPKAPAEPAPASGTGKALAKPMRMKIPWKQVGLVGGSVLAVGLLWGAVKNLTRARKPREESQPQPDPNARQVWHPDHGYGQLPGFDQDVWKR